MKNDGSLSFEMPEESKCEEILRFWQVKREQVGHALLPNLKHEDLSAKIGADPYVCFRRREIKAPRKTRRTDAQCMDKLKRLHYDLATSKVLLEAAFKRDKYKRECLVLETCLFEKYWAIESWKKGDGFDPEWKTPDVPAFRAAAQSVLEPKKKKTRPQSTAEVSQLSSSQPVRSQGTMQSGLKSMKYFKPYYSIDVLKQIQKDMDLIMVNEASRLQDFTGDLDSDDDNVSFNDTRAIPDLSAGLPCFSRFRVGKSGMVQLDRRPIRDETESRPRLQYKYKIIGDYPFRINRIRKFVFKNEVIECPGLLSSSQCACRKL